jgi:predicted CoA-binding protein
VLICVLPAEITLTLLTDITARKPKLIWLQPGAESMELVEAIKSTGIPVKHDICFMKEYGIW